MNPLLQKLLRQTSLNELLKRKGSQQDTEDETYPGEVGEAKSSVITEDPYSLSNDVSQVDNHATHNLRLAKVIARNSSGENRQARLQVVMTVRC
ncbi:hypothetical protein Tco_1103584 [Tanacetum coccineum]